MTKSKSYLFTSEAGVRVWHVLHDRYRYPLQYWYCLDPSGIPGQMTERCMASAFDIRNFPAELTADLDIEANHSERLGHTEAIRRAIRAGYDILAGERAAQERERERWAEYAKRPLNPAIPF